MSVVDRDFPTTIIIQFFEKVPAKQGISPGKDWSSTGNLKFHFVNNIREILQTLLNIFWIAVKWFCENNFQKNYKKFQPENYLSFELIFWLNQNNLS